MLYLWSGLMLFLGMLDLGTELVTVVSGNTSCATLSLVNSLLDTLADLTGVWSAKVLSLRELIVDLRDKISAMRLWTCQYGQ